MRAALERGRWTFLAERAPLVRQAFHDFATGRYTKHEVRKAINARGLKTRRDQPVPSQTFDAMLRNRVYIGLIDVAACGIATRGDFGPLITEKVFYRVQGILDGRLEITVPRPRSNPDFPLRGAFAARCAASL